MANFFDSHVLNATLLDSLASAVLAIDSAGTILLWNRAAEEMLGYTKEEIVGKLNIRVLEDTETLQNVRGEFAQAFGKKELSDVELLFTVAAQSVRQRRMWKYKTKVGRIINVEASLTLVQSSQTLQTQAPQNQTLMIALRDDIQQQQGLAELKTALLSRLSHEMRTPLHGIVGALELLAATPLTAEQQEILELARSKSDILISLMNDIFEYSRSQGHSLSLERVPTEPRAIMRNIVEVLSERIASRSLTIAPIIDDAVPGQVLSDPVRLYQVLLTVVSVLASFMNDGVIHIGLEFLPSANNDIGGLYFTVRGVAASMNTQKRTQILALIQHEEESPDVSAESLQLSLARSVIMAMGGFFWSEKKEYLSAQETIMYIVVSVESVVGNDLSGSGTNVSATDSPKQALHQSANAAPNGEAALANAETPTTPSQASPSASIQTCRRILVVDDDPDNCHLAALFLRGLTDEKGNAPLVSIAMNGLEALEAAQKQRFDAILMDVQMPQMDGFEATECIRAFERNNHFKRTPILAVTAHTMENYRELCLQKGMDDYMSKPVKKQQLQEFVKKWLDRKPIVLIADDSDDYRLLLKLHFDKMKRYSLIFATNGQEAIDLCQNHDVDAILLDMQMPVMTGYEAAPVLRQMPKYSSIPVWGLTAHEDLQEIEKVLEAGCDKCFTKGNMTVIRQIICELDTHFAIS